MDTGAEAVTDPLELSQQRRRARLIYAKAIVGAAAFTALAFVA